MTPQQIVGLAVRLFSLWLLILAFQIIGYGNGINDQAGVSPTRVHYLLSAFVSILALLLWFFPMLVAHKLIPKTQFDNVLRIHAQETVIVACIIFSLWIFVVKVLPTLAFYIPLIVVIAQDHQPPQDYDEFRFRHLASIAIEFVMAIVLALKAKAISRFLLTPQKQEKIK